MKFPAALDLFERTLLTEHDRPDVHAAMLTLASPETITSVSSQLHDAIAAGERVWMSADLHIGHANIIPFCNRPFANVVQMNEHLVSQTAKVQDDEWLVIVGDLAMGNHQKAMQWIRRIPGRKVLVLGNHDLRRDGQCLYLSELALDGQRLLFEATVPFLAWRGNGGQDVFVSHYPATTTHDAAQLLNSHGHLHRQALPPTEKTHFVNAGWDVTQGLLCL